MKNLCTRLATVTVLLVGCKQESGNVNISLFSSILDASTENGAKTIRVENRRFVNEFVSSPETEARPYRQVRLVLAEHESALFHPSIGWLVQSLELAAYKYSGDGDFEEKELWRVSHSAEIDVKWKIEDAYLEVVTSNSTDGSLTKVFRYSAFTGEEITDSEQNGAGKTDP